MITKFRTVESPEGEEREHNQGGEDKGVSNVLIFKLGGGYIGVYYYSLNKLTTS